MAIVYTTHNAFDYMNMHRKEGDDARTGVCMGAAATWCRFALKANYEADPCSWSNLPEVKELATEYVFRVNPCAETRQFLELQLERSLPSGQRYAGIEHYELETGAGTETRTKTTPGLPVHKARQIIVKSHQDYMTSQTKDSRHVKDGNWQVNLVLEIAGLVGLKVVVPSQTSTAVVNYVKSYEGIYLLFNSGHFMAASSVKDHWYFYDNENALFRCHGSEELFETIKSCREKEGDWANNRWYAYRIYH